MAKTNETAEIEPASEPRPLDLVEHPALSRCYGAAIAGGSVFVGMLLAHLYAYSDGFNPLRFSGLRPSSLVCGWSASMALALMAAPVLGQTQRRRDSNAFLS